MSSPRGFRQGYPNVIDAIRDTLADTNNAGSITADDFDKLARIPTGQGPTLTLCTAALDLTQAQDVALPALPGFYSRFLSGGWILTANAGTLSTSPTFKVGNNGAFDNLAGSQTPSWATAFATGAPTIGPTITAISPGSVQLVNLSTPITLSITAGATGVGLTLTGRMFWTFSPVPV